MLIIFCGLKNWVLTKIEKVKLVNAETLIVCVDNLWVDVAVFSYNLSAAKTPFGAITLLSETRELLLVQLVSVKTSLHFLKFVLCGSVNKAPFTCCGLIKD